eukprot:137872-Pleurochrysis_carterae.AAC.2
MDMRETWARTASRRVQMQRRAQLLSASHVLQGRAEEVEFGCPCCKKRELPALYYIRAGKAANRCLQGQIERIQPPKVNQSSTKTGAVSLISVPGCPRSG